MSIHHGYGRYASTFQSLWCLSAIDMIHHSFLLLLSLYREFSQPYYPRLSYDYGCMVKKKRK